MPVNQKYEFRHVTDAAIQIFKNTNPNPLEDPKQLLFITKRLVTAEWRSCKLPDEKAVFLRRESLAKLLATELARLQAGDDLEIDGGKYTVDDIMDFLYQEVDDTRKEPAKQFYKSAEAFRSGRATIQVGTTLVEGGDSDESVLANRGSFESLPTIPKTPNNPHLTAANTVVAHFRKLAEVLNIFEYDLADANRPSDTPEHTNPKVRTLNKIDQKFSVFGEDYANSPLTAQITTFFSYSMTIIRALFASNDLLNSQQPVIFKEMSKQGLISYQYQGHISQEEESEQVTLETDTKHKGDAIKRLLGDFVSPKEGINEHAPLKDLIALARQAETATHGEGLFDASLPKAVEKELSEETKKHNAAQSATTRLE